MKLSVSAISEQGKEKGCNEASNAKEEELRFGQNKKGEFFGTKLDGYSMMRGRSRTSLLRPKTSINLLLKWAK